MIHSGNGIDFIGGQVSIQLMEKTRSFLILNPTFKEDRAHHYSGNSNYYMNIK